MKKQDLVTLAMICISAGLLIGGCVQKSNTQQFGKRAEQMSSDMQSFYNGLSSDSQRKFMALDMRHKRAAFQMTNQGMDANTAVEQQYQDQSNRSATNGTGYQYQQGNMSGSSGYANGGSALSADMQDFYYALSTDGQKKFMALDMRHKRAAMAVVSQGGIDANSAVDQQYQDQMKQRGMTNGANGSGYSNRSPYASDRERETQMQYGYGQPSMYSETNSATALSTDMQNFYDSLTMDSKTKFMALDQRHKKAAMQQATRRNMDPNQSVEKHYGEQMRQQGYYYKTEDSTSTSNPTTNPNTDAYNSGLRSGYGSPTTGYSSNYNFQNPPQPQQQPSCPGGY